MQAAGLDAPGHPAVMAESGQLGRQGADLGFHRARSTRVHVPTHSPRANEIVSSRLRRIRRPRTTALREPKPGPGAVRRQKGRASKRPCRGNGHPRRRLRQVGTRVRRPRQSRRRPRAQRTRQPPAPFRCEPSGNFTPRGMGGSMHAHQVGRRLARRATPRCAPRAGCCVRAIGLARELERKYRAALGTYAPWNSSTGVLVTHMCILMDIYVGISK
jgi:hypothetical protein